MFGLVFKFSIAFTISFILLSFNFSNKPLFYHLTKLTGPFGHNIQKSINKSVNKSFNKTKELGKQLFQNSKPRYMDDSIKSRQSSVKKRKNLNRNQKTYFIQENLQRKEQIQLDRLIEKN